MLPNAFQVPYGISRTLPNTELSEAKSRITQALAAEGFGILTEIDISATLQKKIGAEFPPYVILGACNPLLAHRALTADPAVGLLLPCNVVVAQNGPDVAISAIAPEAMFQVMQPPPALMAVAAEAEARLRRAVSAC